MPPPATLRECYRGPSHFLHEGNTTKLLNHEQFSALFDEEFIIIDSITVNLPPAEAAAAAAAGAAAALAAGPREFIIVYTNKHQILVGKSADDSFQLINHLDLLTEPCVRDAAITTSVFTSSVKRAQFVRPALQIITKNDHSFTLALQCEFGVMAVLHFRVSEAEPLYREERKVIPSSFIADLIIRSDDENDSDEMFPEKDEGMSVIASDDDSSESLISAEAFELVSTCECMQHNPKENSNGADTRALCHPLSRSAIITPSTTSELLIVLQHSYCFNFIQLINSTAQASSDLVIIDWYAKGEVSAAGSSDVSRFHFLCGFKGLVMSMTNHSRGSYFELEIAKKINLAGWKHHIVREYRNLPMSAHTLNPDGIVVADNAIILLNESRSIILANQNTIDLAITKMSNKSVDPTRPSSKSNGQSLWSLPVSLPLLDGDGTIESDSQMLARCHRAVLEIYAGEAIDFYHLRGMASGNKISLYGCRNLSLLPGCISIGSGRFVLNPVHTDHSIPQPLIEAAWGWRDAPFLSHSLILFTKKPLHLRFAKRTDWLRLSDEHSDEDLLDDNGKSVFVQDPDEDGVTEQDSMTELFKAEEDKSKRSTSRFICDTLADCSRTEPVCKLPNIRLDHSSITNISVFKQGLLAIYHTLEREYLARVCTQSFVIEISQENLHRIANISSGWSLLETNLLALAAHDVNVVAIGKTHLFEKDATSLEMTLANPLMDAANIDLENYTLTFDEIEKYVVQITPNSINVASRMDKEEDLTAVVSKELFEIETDISALDHVQIAIAARRITNSENPLTAKHRIYRVDLEDGSCKYYKFDIEKLEITEEPSSDFYRLTCRENKIIRTSEGTAEETYIWRDRSFTKSSAEAMADTNDIEYTLILSDDEKASIVLEDNLLLIWEDDPVAAQIFPLKQERWTIPKSTADETWKLRPCDIATNSQESHPWFCLSTATQIYWLVPQNDSFYVFDGGLKGDDFTLLKNENWIISSNGSVSTMEVMGFATNSYRMTSDNLLMSWQELPLTRRVRNSEIPVQWEIWSISGLGVSSSLTNAHILTMISRQVGESSENDELIDPRLEESGAPWRDALAVWGDVADPKERRRRVWIGDTSFALDPHERVKTCLTVSILEDTWTILGTLPRSRGLYPDVGRILIFAHDISTGSQETVLSSNGMSHLEPCFTMNVIGGVNDCGCIRRNDCDGEPAYLVWFAAGFRVWVRELHSNGHLKGGTFISCPSAVTNVQVIDGQYFLIATELHGLVFAALQTTTTKRCPASGATQYLPLCLLQLARTYSNRNIGMSVCGFVTKAPEVMMIGGDDLGNLWIYKFFPPKLNPASGEPPDNWKELQLLKHRRYHKGFIKSWQREDTAAAPGNHQLHLMTLDYEIILFTFDSATSFFNLL